VVQERRRVGRSAQDQRPLIATSTNLITGIRQVSKLEQLAAGSSSVVRDRFRITLHDTTGHNVCRERICVVYSAHMARSRLESALATKIKMGRKRDGVEEIGPKCSCGWRLINDVFLGTRIW
jgi:hypothetical protein